MDAIFAVAFSQSRLDGGLAILASSYLMFFAASLRLIAAKLSGSLTSLRARKSAKAS